MLLADQEQQQTPVVGRVMYRGFSQGAAYVVNDELHTDRAVHSRLRECVFELFSIPRLRSGQNAANGKRPRRRIITPTWLLTQCTWAPPHASQPVPFTYPRLLRVPSSRHSGSRTPLHVHHGVATRKVPDSASAAGNLRVRRA